MGKKKKIDKNNNKTVKSINNGVRSSVRKLNPILKSIVGKKVDVAIRDLQFSEKRITKDIRKTISSAVANAENNFQYDIDNLIVKEAYCGKKIIMKRFTISLNWGALLSAVSRFSPSKQRGTGRGPAACATMAMIICCSHGRPLLVMAGQQPAMASRLKHAWHG